MKIKCIKKLRSCNGGFTLLEMVIVVFILVMLTAVMARIMPVAVEAYHTEVDASNSDLLMSTTLAELRDELGTASSVTVTDSKTIKCKSGNTGSDAVITSKEDGIYITNFDGAAATGKQKEEKLLVSKAAATKNLHCEYDSIEYDSSAGVITINDIVVKNQKGSVLVEIEKYQIRSEKL